MTQIQSLGWGIWWGLFTVVFGASLEMYFASSRIVDIFLFASVEEIFKYSGLMWIKPRIGWYVYGAALPITLIEFGMSYQSLAPRGYDVLFLRMIPHILFASVFLLLQNRGKKEAFGMAVLSHYIWNMVCSLDL